MITTTEYSVDFNHQYFKGIPFFHKTKPATINDTDHPSHGSSMKMSFSPAPKTKKPSEIKYKKMGDNISGVNKMTTFLKNTKQDSPYSF